MGARGSRHKRGEHPVPRALMEGTYNGPITPELFARTMATPGSSCRRSCRVRARARREIERASRPPRAHTKAGEAEEAEQGARVSCDRAMASPSASTAAAFRGLYRVFLRTLGASVLEKPGARRNLRDVWRHSRMPRAH
jgi:hypothetical protein